VSDGGLVDGSLDDAYDTAMELEIDDDEFCCADWPRFELNRRQLVLGPSFNEPLIVTRKVFVPEAGGFARYLELLSNPSNVARSVRVRVRTDVGASSSTRLAVAPATTGNTYAVTDEFEDESNGLPVIAHVFNGPGAPVTVAATDFRNHRAAAFHRPAADGLGVWTGGGRRAGGSAGVVVRSAGARRAHAARALTDRQLRDPQSARVTRQH
jgi:hypothetical protein